MVQTMKNPPAFSWTLLPAMCLLAAGCATGPEPTSTPLSAAGATSAAVPVDVSRYSFRLSTARKVERGKGATDVSRSFDYEGQIFAFAAIGWPPGSPGGAPEIGVRWYNDKGLVSEQQRRITLEKPPHYVWFATTGLALGPCGCRVDLVANGQVVASQSFAVNPR